MSLLTPPSTPRTSWDSDHAERRASSSGDKYRTPSPSSKLQGSLLLTPPYTPESDGKIELRRASVESSLSSESGRISRQLSENELSYFLPSRQDGVNDMYLHHTLLAPASVMDSTRILHLWTYQLLHHPLLASRIASNSYTDVSFAYSRPPSLPSALIRAEALFYHSSSGGNMIDTYLNGPRTLGPTRLAMLRVGSPAFRPSTDNDTAEPGEEPRGEYEVMLCATHFLGDGMALHTFLNEFYALLGSSRTTRDFADLIEAELATDRPLPVGLEGRLPLVGGGSNLAAKVGAEEYKRFEGRLVGGQGFPPNTEKRERKTLVPTFAYTAEETKRILGACKAKGVTVAHAVFALCNIAWARRTESREAPCLIYSALNLRPNMLPSPDPTSYFHLAVGYFNIVLPTLLPSTLTTSEVFWHRARCTKSQTTKAVKSPFLVARSRETSKVRKDRAVKWAKIDDEEADARKDKDKEASGGSLGGIGLGLGISLPNRKSPTKGSFPTQGVATYTGTPPLPQTPWKTPGSSMTPTMSSPLSNVDNVFKASSLPSRRGKARVKPVAIPSAIATPTPLQAEVAPESPPPTKRDYPKLPPANQRALMGVSMLGNLDGMYKHAEFGGIQLQSLTTGSRQRPGALLLFAYTFAGKLWMSLGYDVNGFEEGAIEGFWEEVQGLVEEVLL